MSTFTGTPSLVVYGATLDAYCAIEALTT